MADTRGKAHKRGNGEGNIRQRANGRWEARLTRDGVSKSLYGATYEEVRKKLTAAIRGRDLGLPGVHDERQTLATFLAGWLDRVKPTIRATTHRRYRELLTLHAIPTLGKVALVKLTPDRLEALYAAKLSEGLAPATVRQLHIILHHALKDALRKELVSRNVSELVSPPRVPRYKARALSLDETLRLLDAVRGDRLEALYVLALQTGMREGELLALTWQSVDLERATLQVSATLHHDKSGFTTSEPKTEQSRRAVPLAPATVSALRAHRARQHTERLALGAAWHESGLVFTDTTGGPLDAIKVLRTQFYPLLRRAGLPSIRFHDLRHSAASLLRNAGHDLQEVQHLLGHATIAITADVYSHLSTGSESPVAATMERLFSQRRG